MDQMIRELSFTFLQVTLSLLLPTVAVRGLAWLTRLYRIQVDEKMAARLLGAAETIVIAMERRFQENGMRKQYAHEALGIVAQELRVALSAGERETILEAALAKTRTARNP